jgi:chromatin assembly factor 1 subunit A
MEPPRIPLNIIKVNSSTTVAPPQNKPFFAPASSSSSTIPSSTRSKSAKPPKLLPADDIPKFKEAVQGSNLSKVGLIEVLKKQFPGRPAAAIKGTLETVARRVGVKEVDKRWVVVEESNP